MAKCGQMGTGRVGNSEVMFAATRTKSRVFVKNEPIFGRISVG